MKNITLLVIVASIFLGFGCTSETEFIRESIDNPVNNYFEVKKAYYYCRSTNFEYEAVEMNIPDNSMNVSIKLYNQESVTACLRESTYGLVNEYTIYCQDGCQGRFMVTYELEVNK